MELWSILTDILLLLASCLLLGGLASRFGQSPLIGYLVAGMVLGGPGSIRLVGSQHQIEAIAELGVALLLFSLGLEFSVERLNKLGSKPLLGGGLQVALTVALVAGISMLFGLDSKQSVAMGVMLSLSSTAIVLRMLVERSELEMPHGRNSLGVLLTQDIAVVPLALIMTVLGGEGTSTDIAIQIGKLLAWTVALVLALYALTIGAKFALGRLTLERNRELTVLLATVAGLGSAWAAHSIGISPALGAFVAGMLLGSSDFATQIRSDISSLRVLLLTLFFGSAGMVADPLWILQNWYVVLAVVAVVVIGKVLIVAVLFALLRQPLQVSIATGLCLAQVGEFAFVLGTVGRTSGVVSEDMYALVVSVTIASFFLSAVLVPSAMRVGSSVTRWLGGSAESMAAKVDSTAPNVVIVGFGPSGQLAAKPTVEHACRVTVIDLNQEGVRKAQLMGFVGHVGDATQPDVLEHAQVHEAQLVVITIPHPLTALNVLELVRHMNPNAKVIVRSRYELHVDRLSSAGATVVGDESTVGAVLADSIRQTLLANDAPSCEADESVEPKPKPSNAAAQPASG